MNFLTRFGSVISVSALVGSASAADFSNVRPHAFVDIGANWVEDMRLNSLGGVGLGNAKLRLDPGVRLGLGAGASINDYVVVGVESGFSFNQFDQVRNVPGAGQFEGEFWQVPVMGTLKLQYPNPSGFVPFIGGGVGGAYSVMTADNLTIGGVRGATDTSGDSFDFAYSAFGGVAWNYSERASIGLTYKFYAIDNPQWDFDGTRLRGRDVYSHTVALVFGYRF